MSRIADWLIASTFDECAGGGRRGAIRRRWRGASPDVAVRRATPGWSGHGTRRSSSAIGLGDLIISVLEACEAADVAGRCATLCRPSGDGHHTGAARGDDCDMVRAGSSRGRGENPEQRCCARSVAGGGGCGEEFLRGLQGAVRGKTKQYERSCVFWHCYLSPTTHAVGAGPAPVATHWCRTTGGVYRGAVCDALLLGNRVRVVSRPLSALACAT